MKKQHTQNTKLFYSVRSLLFLCFWVLPVIAMATHNRAGEITYRQISDYTFEVTITTYTYTLANTDRPRLEVQWGDGLITTVKRVKEVYLPDNYKKNIYVAQHSYPGPGSYEILVQDPNRNYGVLNIPNSVNTVFSVKTTLVINPEVGINQTPVLLNPPLNNAAFQRLFVHNAAAYDPDGDSLSYALTECTGESGEPIEGYELPPTTDSLYFEAQRGNFVWDAPAREGKFNVALAISEWRYGVKIGEIVRDMQIDVYDTDNHPPVLESVADACVVAGDTLEVIVEATDVDGDSIDLTIASGITLFEEGYVAFDVLEEAPGYAKARLRWVPPCMAVRKRMYSVVINAIDDHAEVPLSHLAEFAIHVLAPAPNSPDLSPTTSTVQLQWDNSGCEADSFTVYRTADPVESPLSVCETGIPNSWNYQKVATLDGFSLLDNNNEEGLLQGYEYCYRIVAHVNGTESKPSASACTDLLRGFPQFFEVDVAHSDLSDGVMEVTWLKPRQLDTLLNVNGPFKYILAQSPDVWFQEPQVIDTFPLADTSWVGTALNTEAHPWSYSVALFNDEPGNRRVVGAAQIASSIFLEASPANKQANLRVRRNTPWLVDFYEIYRRAPGDADFSLIDTTVNNFYEDTTVLNEQEYCYYFVGYGQVELNDEFLPNVNTSQRVCVIPKDTVPPEVPELLLETVCDSSLNRINWQYSHESALSDVARFTLFYSATSTEQLDSIASISPIETRFTHYLEGVPRGCYAMVAIDSAGNRSEMSAVSCIDICSYYKLPNVFSPNGDNKNDVYYAYNPNGYVERVDMHIYNRWGEEVFTTTNPNIAWDGKRKDSDKVVTTGVYYYVCDVYEDRLSGEEHTTMVGFIHVYSDQDGN